MALNTGTQPAQRLPNVKQSMWQARNRWRTHFAVVIVANLVADGGQQHAVVGVQGHDLGGVERLQRVVPDAKLRGDLGDLLLGLWEFGGWGWGWAVSKG